MIKEKTSIIMSALYSNNKHSVSLPELPKMFIKQLLSKHSDINIIVEQEMQYKETI